MSATATATVGTTTVNRMFPYTHLPLDRFARIVSYSPILFNQVYITYNELQRDLSCSDPVLQYTWQPRGGGRPGREEIGQAIQQAEDMIYRTLKFSPSPRWFEDEIDLTGASRFNFGSYGGFGVRANNFHLIEPGVEKYSFLVAGAIVYEDDDGDGYKELARLQVDNVWGITDANEISAFPPGQTPEPALEIRPLVVQIDPAYITITVARHLLARWDLQERLDAAGIDGMEDTNFYPELDIYRHWNDPSEAMSVVWPCGGCNVCTACTTSTSTGCFWITDPRNGLVRAQPAVWRTQDGVYPGDPSSSWWEVAGCTWVRTPARVTLRYRAGYSDRRLRRPMVEMAPELERAVAFLALSYMDREWLACEQIRNLQAHWRLDMAAAVGNQAGSTNFKMDSYLLRCPFGTTRAALYAWRVIQPLMVGQAVLDS